MREPLSAWATNVLRRVWEETEYPGDTIVLVSPPDVKTWDTGEAMATQSIRMVGEVGLPIPINAVSIDLTLSHPGYPAGYYVLDVMGNLTEDSRFGDPNPEYWRWAMIGPIEPSS